MDRVTIILTVTAVVVVVAASVPAVLLIVRRHWLATQAGLFVCYARLYPADSDGWVPGVARYTGENLEWFRAVSLSIKPRLSFRRGTLRLEAQRDPAVAELGTLSRTDRIVRLGSGNDAAKAAWELAMSSGAVTGLLSWAESAPPGLRYQSVDTSAVLRCVYGSWPLRHSEVPDLPQVSTARRLRKR